MSWTQLVTPNLNITYTGGECLKAVADAFDIPWNSANRYGAAMTDWNTNEGNHPGEQPPAGVFVPVYFSLSKVPAGHIAISLTDGRIASSTKVGTHTGLYIHPSLHDLMTMYTTNNNGTCTYLGWSESVDKLYVVADQGAANDMNTKQLAHDINIKFGCNWPPDIEQQKADFMTAAGNAQQVLEDGLRAGIDNNEIANTWALTNYDEARGGDNPGQFAADRWAGGDSFPAVIKRDMPNYIQAAKDGDAAQANVTSLQGQLDRADSTISDLQNELRTAKDQLPVPSQPSTTTPTVDCSHEAQAAAQAALASVRANPWPYVWQWLKGGGK